MHNFNTCKKNPASHRQILTNFAAKHVFQSKVTTPPRQRHSFGKYRSCAQTSMRLSSTFWFSEHIANSHGTGKCQRSAFAPRKHARALAAGLPHQNHVYMITAKSFCFHNNEFNEMPCTLNSSENPRCFFRGKAVFKRPLSPTISFFANSNTRPSI